MRSGFAASSGGFVQGGSVGGGTGVWGTGVGDGLTGDRADALPTKHTAVNAAKMAARYIALKTTGERLIRGTFTAALTHALFTLTPTVAGVGAAHACAQSHAFQWPSWRFSMGRVYFAPRYGHPHTKDWTNNSGRRKQTLVRERVLSSAFRDVMATLNSWLPSRDSNPDQRLQRPSSGFGGPGCPGQFGPASRACDASDESCRRLVSGNHRTIFGRPRSSTAPPAGQSSLSATPTTPTATAHPRRRTGTRKTSLSTRSIGSPRSRTTEVVRRTTATTRPATASRRPQAVLRLRIRTRPTVSE